MTIDVDISHRLGSFALDARFTSAGALTAIFGHSGSGKTTLINAIAGLLTPDRGRIAVGGAVLFDSQQNINVPVRKRGLGYVFQDARLFPHLNVRQNLMYGARFASAQRSVMDFATVISLLGIGPLLARRTPLLSGGEKQRVAIGRALLAAPRLLLMDEPMASLDDERKAEILPYIERLRDHMQVPIIYVSHSLAEVSRLASHVVLLEQGHVIASGPAGEVLQHLSLLPASQRREGGSLLDMKVARYDSSYDMTTLMSAAGEAQVPGSIAELGTTVRLRIRAHDVILSLERPQSISALNIFAGRVTAMEGEAPIAVSLDCHGQSIVAAITRQSRDRMGVAVGQEVYAIVKALAVEGGTSRAEPQPAASTRR